MYKGRHIIPIELRSRILATLHSAHQGVTGMKLRAERSCFWPRISKDVEEMRAKCGTCHKHGPSNPDMPPIPPPTPQYPFQHICADYFSHIGNNFGVVVDRFSNWIQVYEGTTGARTLVTIMTSLCRDFGIPEEITHDGGPEFKASEFDTFCKQYGIEHRLTSVAFPHANCRAEVAVKTAKRLIRDNVHADGKLDRVGLTRALLTYRNTPDRDTGLSPAEILLGRQLRDFLPPGKAARDRSGTANPEGVRYASSAADSSRACTRSWERPCRTCSWLARAASKRGTTK